MTSRAITPQQCRNIEKRIEELGFVCAHAPYTRQAIADRLYRNSHWLIEPLGLSGVPPALSSFPKTLRAFRDIPLIGRSSHCEWLRQTPGDCLVVGQPGIGQSFLCQAIVGEGHALFVVDDDIERIAAAIRDQEPTRIIVEDAHLRLELLERLRIFRQQTGASFRIIADCWPGDAAQVQNALMISDSQCLTLATLSRKEIVDILNASGVYGPPILMHRMVQQAMGMPGRAALLAHLCILADDARDVYEGTELAKWACTTFQRLAGERAVNILAGFAIGGESGMTVESVASILGFPFGDVIGDLAKLAHGGVVHEQQRGIYCVLPEPLRSAIIRDKFFSSPVRLPIEPFLVNAVSLVSCVRALIRAYVVGAEISPQDLLSLVRLTDDDFTWELLLRSDVACARLAVAERPELALHYCQPCLLHVPDAVIPALLQSASGDERELHNTPEHPLRQIDDWIKSAVPGSGECVTRRRTLWRHVRDALQHANDTRPAFRALSAVVTPNWEVHTQQPANPDTITFQFGCLVLDDLRQVAAIWDEVWETLAYTTDIDWKYLLVSVDEWLYPGRIATALSKEQQEIMRESGVTIIRRLAQLGRHSPAVLSAVSDRARDLDMQLDVDIDGDYAILFPGDPARDANEWKQRSNEQTAEALSLADRWQYRNPVEVATKLTWCAAEAGRLSQPYPDYSPFVAQNLAERVADVNLWLDALLTSAAPPHLVLPFLDQLRIRRHSGWKDRVRECLAHSPLIPACFQILLGCDDLEPDLESAVNENVGAFQSYVAHRVRQGDLPTRRLKSLLRNSIPEVSGMAASALWSRQKFGNGQIADELMSDWRQAAIFGCLKEHDLTEMLREDTELAFQWLLDRVSTERDAIRYEPDAIKSACSSIKRDQRIALLNQIDPSKWISREILGALVGDDLQLYRNVLQNKNLKRFHLAPLRGHPDEKWVELALVAVEEGVDLNSIATAAFEEIEASFDTIPAKYERHATTWNALLNHPDSRIREIASIGQGLAAKSSEEWLRREREAEFWHTFN